MPVNLTHIPVPDPLKSDVESIRIAQHSGETIHVCLNCLPGIVFQHHNGHSPLDNIVTRSGFRQGAPTLFVYGQITEPGIMHHKNVPFTTIQVVLKPHALQTLLGIKASALTNAVVPLNEFAAEDLNLRLMEAGSTRECIALVTGFLAAKLMRAKTRDCLIEESLSLIQKSAGCISVKFLLERLNISERQFERRFIQTVGIAPQFYIRVKRFNAAIRLMQTRQFEKMTDVAHALNFYDQSHFIRDIKAFSGITPKSLFEKMGAFEQSQSVYAYV
jgi:AraC-like DNA-binding protein